ncbi:MAG: UbiA prenyltransferase family protein [Lentisphaeria bacterium]|nr:UbiA prenyltransferase family protein [Lentisphaeria bacterium]
MPTGSVTDTAASTPRAWMELLRVPHWSKNAIVFPAVLLAGHAREVAVWVRAGWVFAAFCLAASAVYILNDYFDRDADRQHPAKSRRPLVARRVGVRAALWMACVLASASVGVALCGGAPVAMGVGAYLLLNLAYDVWLKHIPAVDVCCVATGFVLRLGALFAPLLFTPRHLWVLASTFCLCGFVGFCKRGAELAVVRAQALEMSPRRSLDGYTSRLFPALPAAVGGFCVGVYGMGMWVVPGGWRLLLTLPFVAYALWRFGRASLQGRRDDQVDHIRSDGYLLGAGGVWLALWIWIGMG